MPTPAIPRKVLIYATSRRGLLVFDEPEYPDVPLQVPGGTVEPDEDLEAAAVSEFFEETGLSPSGPFRHLVTARHSYTRDGHRRVLERSYFHVRIDDDAPAEWIHVEQTPHDGSAPIAFRLHWMSLDDARTRLGLGMGEYLHRLNQA